MRVVERPRRPGRGRVHAGSGDLELERRLADGEPLVGHEREEVPGAQGHEGDPPGVGVVAVLDDVGDVGAVAFLALHRHPEGQRRAQAGVVREVERHDRDHRGVAGGERRLAVEPVEEEGRHDALLEGRRLLRQRAGQQRNAEEKRRRRG